MPCQYEHTLRMKDTARLNLVLRACASTNVHCVTSIPHSPNLSLNESYQPEGKLLINFGASLIPRIFEVSARSLVILQITLTAQTYTYVYTRRIQCLWHFRKCV